LEKEKKELYIKVIVSKAQGKQPETLKNARTFSKEDNKKNEVLSNDDKLESIWT
jgi:hypothetical protein